MTSIDKLSINTSDVKFPGQTGVYHGKVRDVFYFDEKILLVASDRISAFDHILSRSIPFKGQVLNGIAEYFLSRTSHLVPNWLEACPHPNVAVGKRCEPIKLEMVIRKYCTGHAWRTYRSGSRMLCGISMPEGMKENDPFDQPIITPATKADEGHDEDISKEEILAKGIVTEEQWETLVRYTRSLFQFGTEMAAERGLILVDTKYEFGLHNGEIVLMDEIHTPDSSRYFYLDGYAERQEKGEPQKQLSKEFVREWLMDNGFQGKEGQTMPEMPDDFVWEVSKRYRELYEILVGKAFAKDPTSMDSKQIEKAVIKYLNEV